MKWPIQEHTDDLDKIVVTVRDKEEKMIYECSTGPNDREATIEGLQPSVQYTVTVTAHYQNEVTRKCSKEFYNCSKCTTHVYIINLPSTIESSYNSIT